MELSLKLSLKSGEVLIQLATLAELIMLCTSIQGERYGEHLKTS